MVTSVFGGGPRTWNMVRDKEGHRDYDVIHLVISDLVGVDGPAAVLTTPGLPQIGDIWTFGNDIDTWAFCHPDARVTVHEEVEGHKPRVYAVMQRFSTRPMARCQDLSVEDPLLEPPRISGTFVKYTKEATKDKDGNQIKSSSHEVIRGPQVEFDHNRPAVRIEQNVADLELDVIASMVDTVNNAELWGLGARKIKLSNAPWERKFNGLCDLYFTRILEFDIDDNTFDKTAVDEGTKALRGEWHNYGTQANPNWLWKLEPNVDKNNPAHFDQFLDTRGNPGRTLLDGQGQPLDFTVPGTGTSTGTGALTTGAEIDVQYYPESDFTQLGIPTDLNFTG